MIPLSLFKLPSELLHVYCAVRSFDWQKEGEGRAGCTASAKTIAERIGKGERQTRDNLQRLADCGAVRIEPQKGGAPRVLCTPDNFDPAKIPPAADRRTPQPRQSTADGPAVHRRTPRQSTAGGVRQSTADELETVSRDKKQRQEVETSSGSAPRPRQPTAGPLVLFADEPRKAAKAPKAPPPVALSTPTWEAYAAAYEARHGAPPVRDALVNRQLKDFVSRVGAEDAPAIAAHYLGDVTPFYVQQRHPISLLLRDYQKLRTDWLTGRRSNPGARWSAQPNRPSAREDQEFTEADLDRLLEESK